MANKTTVKIDERVVPGFSFRGLKYQLAVPYRSFFSPINGIPAGTIITLTGEILIKIFSQPFPPGVLPRPLLEVGITWGKNMKGTDWISPHVLDGHIARPIVDDPILSKAQRVNAALFEIKKDSVHIPRRRRH